MIKVTFITFGKLKEKYLRDAADEYIKRLSRYCDLTVIEPEPKKLPEHPSGALVQAALKAESETVLKKLPDNAYVVALCVEGKQISSEALADRLAGLSAQGRHIVFILGSSYGLDDSVKKRADLCLSVSEMTFPHQLFRIMLLEQLYRAFRINEGSDYHK